MNPVKLAMDHPWATAGGIFAIGAIIVIYATSGGGGEASGPQGVVMVTGNSAADVQAATALAITQANNTAAVSIANIQADARKSEIAASTTSEAGLFAFLRDKLTTEANVQMQTINTGAYTTQRLNELNADFATRNLAANREIVLNKQNLDFQKGVFDTQTGANLSSQQMGFDFQKFVFGTQTNANLQTAGMAMNLDLEKNRIASSERVSLHNMNLQTQLQNEKNGQDFALGQMAQANVRQRDYENFFLGKQRMELNAYTLGVPA